MLKTPLVFVHSFRSLLHKPKLRFQRRLYQRQKAIECLGCLSQELALILVFLRYVVQGSTSVARAASARADGFKCIHCRGLRNGQRRLVGILGMRFLAVPVNFF